MKMFILSFSAKFVLTWQLCSNSCHFLCTTRKYHHYQLNMYIGPTNFFIVGIHIKDFLAMKYEWHITYIFWNYKRDSLRIVCKTISNYKHSYQLLNDTYKWSTGTQTIERNKASLVFEEIQKFWGRNNLINCLLTIDFHKVVKTVYSSIWYWMYFIWLNVE